MRAYGSPRTGGQPLNVSIVVPVLNEEARVARLLSRLRDAFPECELISVDGGSRDRTAALASRYARVVRSEPGRARQMNSGAEAATGQVLWFVHADTHVSPEALSQLRAALSDGRVVGGGLRLRFDRRSPSLDWVAWTSNLRARYLGWVFGDQALFVRRAVFAELGGFPDLPIMEDLEMSRRLRRRGRLAVLDATSTASARRFTERGTLWLLALMLWLKAAYFLGFDPERIQRLYVSAHYRRRSARAPYWRPGAGAGQ